MMDYKFIYHKLFHQFRKYKLIFKGNLNIFCLTNTELSILLLSFQSNFPIEDL